MAKKKNTLQMPDCLALFRKDKEGAMLTQLVTRNPAKRKELLAELDAYEAEAKEQFQLLGTALSRFYALSNFSTLFTDTTRAYIEMCIAYVKLEHLFRSIPTIRAQLSDPRRQTKDGISIDTLHHQNIPLKASVKDAEAFLSPPTEADLAPTNGWLSPEGTFHPCMPWEHRLTAVELLSLPETSFAEDVLLKKGGLRLSGCQWLIGDGKKPTNKQFAAYKSGNGKLFKSHSFIEDTPAQDL